MKISNQSAFKNSDTRLGLAQVPSNDIVVTYFDDYWDGPLSGMCMWKSEQYYFLCFDQVDESTQTDLWPRKFLLIKLTAEQLVEQERQHQLFEASKRDEEARREYLNAFAEFPEQTIERDQLTGWFNSEGLRYTQQSRL